jgi:hypothetical protein
LFSGHDLDNDVERVKVGRVSRAERESIRARCGGDEQVDCPCSAGFAASAATCAHGRGSAQIILDHLDDLESAMETGAVVVVGDDRIREHLLPPLPDD